MASSDNGNQKEQIEESNDEKMAGQISLLVSSSQRTLLNGGNPRRKFKRLAQERDEVSQLVASSSGHRIRGVFGKKIDWVSLMKMSKEWIRDPMNMALFVWIMCVAISGAILFLVMTGMLNKALPKKSQRDAWFEVNNQILNALFTLMCLYHHPKRFFHLVLLCRWKPEDVSRLRKVYCKNGTYKPHEWAHMMVVVVLLHINCFAQYALCGLNWGFKRSERPPIGVGICISFAIAAPALAGLYTIVSPLGKDYVSEMDEEAQKVVDDGESGRSEWSRRKSFEKRYSFASGDDERIVEIRPLWSGGILDFWNDISLAYLSVFCSCCVFGWNMERLGFGNMYVHIATFLLFCMAPFWIFNLAAVNIDNETVREALGFTGIVLCLFGLCYGGFWRIQMRKRFNLPAYNFCFGNPGAADCTLWLFCCWCTLAQEVRTGNSYDIVEDKLLRKQTNNGNELPMSPLPREGGSIQFSPDPSSSPGYNSIPTTRFTTNSSSPKMISKEYHSPDRQVSTAKEEFSVVGKDETMIPPTPSPIQRDET
ncbi:putative Senescence associated protein 20 [Hibiscus syriacus]|uniref:Senescence associated protein 20 n=1 Tax=Hibiscus syriacus TaxID=106335 RepID=A0A6A2Z313_HIBSY|nr:putative Senescence associated protein 20 [Hibiscus syriacus]